MDTSHALAAAASMQSQSATAANGYVLTTSLLIAAYVRHLEDEDYEKLHAESSLLSADRALERRTIARSSVNALATFLLDEIQQPNAAKPSASDSANGRSAEGEPTTLSAVFQRLQQALPRPEDVSVLVDEVLQVLASVDSPDAVSDVVDAIGECVAPLTRSLTGESVEPLGDAANALLLRKSVFGVFVRRFVLAVNRLLFDGLSRVFDEVTRYREEYADHQTALRHRYGAATATQSDISLSLTSSPSSRFLWKQGDDMDDLPLSPIVGASTTADTEPKEFATLVLQSNDESVGNVGRRTIDIMAPGQSHHPPAADSPPSAMNSLSRDQMQYFLHDIIQDLERGLTLSSTTASSTKNAAAIQLLQPMEDSMDPDALFVKYLDAVNQRDYEAALELLHQYHDVALSRTQRFRQTLRTRNRAAAAAAGSTSADGTAGANASSSGLHFLGSGVQYAALNLAGLHIAFNRFAAAQDSIQEAIRVAQHHGDHICVAFALSWFVRVQLAQGKPRHQVSALIASALERAEELSLPSLQTLVSLTALEYELLLGGLVRDGSSTASNYAAVARFPSPRPLDLWSRVNDVDHVLTQLGESVSTAMATSGSSGRTLGNLMNMQQQQQQMQQGGGAAVNPRADGKKTNGMTWKHSIEAVLNMMWSLQGKARTAAAIGWQLFGARALSDTFDSVFWSAYRESASSSEIASWISRVVFTRLEWGSEDGASASDSGISVEGDTASQFTAAFVLMRGALRQPELQRHQLLRREKILQRTIQHLLAEWSLNRGEYALAEAHIAQLVSLSSASTDCPARVEALILQARLWGESEQYLRCFHELDELEAFCEDRGYEYLLAQVLILKGEYLRRSRVPRSTFDALPSILRAIQICKTSRFDLLLAEAHIVVAEINIAMGKAQEAVDLLDQQMPLVMEHGSIRLRAASQLVIAKATLAAMASAPVMDAQKVLGFLDDSAALYRRLENWRQLREISFLKTAILRNRADAATADAAKAFLYYEQLLRAAQHSSNASAPVTAVDSISLLDRIVQARGFSLAL